MASTRHAVCCVLSLAGASAHAGRPLATEDAAVLEPRQCELELVHTRTRDSGATSRSVGGQVGCGIGYRTQLAVAAERSTSAGASTTASGFTGKTFVKQLTHDAWGLTLGYGLGFVEFPGASTKLESSDIVAVVTLPYREWLLHANLGASRSRSARATTTTWALAAERVGAVGPVDLMAEVYGDDTTSESTAAVALRWEARKDSVWLDASYGVNTAPGRPRMLSIGMKLAF